MASLAHYGQGVYIENLASFVHHSAWSSGRGLVSFYVSALKPANGIVF